MKIIKNLWFLIMICIFLILSYYLEFGSKSNLHKAVGKNDMVALLILIKDGGNINAKDGKGFTPLHIAAQKSNFQMVTTLIKHGADVNSKAAGHATPLHFAAQEGNMAIAKLLIAMGAEVNAKDKDGRTALNWIRKREWASPEMVEFLELHEDALMIWEKVKSEREYGKVVDTLRTSKEFQEIRKRNDEEFQEYINKLKNLRGVR